MPQICRRQEDERLDQTVSCLRDCTVASSELLIHPFYIFRVAGVSTDLLAHTQAGIVGASLRTIAGLEHKIGSARDALCLLLEQRVHDNPVQAQVRQLLNLKRSFFNRKAASPANLEALRCAFSDEQYGQLSAYNASLLRLRSLSAKLEDDYLTDLACSRAHLARLWQEPLLQDALAYTNPKLFREIEQQVRSAKYSGKKQLQIEDTLLQYYLRSATKTSPLSTFTLVALDKWGSGESSSVQLRLDGDVSNHVHGACGASMPFHGFVCEGRFVWITEVMLAPGHGQHLRATLHELFGKHKTVVVQHRDRVSVYGKRGRQHALCSRQPAVPTVAPG